VGSGLTSSNQPFTKNRPKASTGTDQPPEAPRKSAILRAIKDVFPNVDETKGAAIYE
jgi:hypothetical protein